MENSYDYAFVKTWKLLSHKKNTVMTNKLFFISDEEIWFVICEIIGALVEIYNFLYYDYYYLMNQNQSLDLIFTIQ